MFEFLVSFVKWSPLVSIMLLSLGITIILTWLYKVLTNQTRAKEIKERQKALREEAKQNASNPEKLAEIQKEMMQISTETMKMSFKPMIITFIPLLLTFAGLKWLYMDAAKVGDIITWGVNLPIIGTGGGWFFCYIIFGFVFSLIFRKIFKVN